MATLQKLGDQAQCPINAEELKIGRAPDNDIVIEDDSVSSYHAIVTTKSVPGPGCNGPYTIRDLKSTNKTFVNNKEVTSQELSDGDIIRLGRVRLKYSTEEYYAPQEEMEKTIELKKSKIPSFLFMK